MFTTLIVFQVLAAAGLIAIVLVQRGPGATMGAAFGSGASGTVFGSRGAGNFLTRTTSGLAVAFFGISLTLAVLATSVGSNDADSALSGSVLEQNARQQEQEQAQEAETGVAIESVIEDLDNPEAGREAAPAGSESRSEAAGESGEESDDELPEPPQGL